VMLLRRNLWEGLMMFLLLFIHFFLCFWNFLYFL
jgi:hypothetical protein